TAEGRYVVDASSGELVIIEEAFNKDEFSRVSRNSVRRKVRPVGATQVEVARSTAFIVDDGSRPEASDPPPLVAPRAAESSGPAPVGEDSRRLNLPIVVAALCKSATRRVDPRDDAEAGVLDRLEREAALF